VNPCSKSSAYNLRQCKLALLTQSDARLSGAEAKRGTSHLYTRLLHIVIFIIMMMTLVRRYTYWRLNKGRKGAKSFLQPREWMSSKGWVAIWVNIRHKNVTDVSTTLGWLKSSATCKKPPKEHNSIALVIFNDRADGHVRGQVTRT